MYPGHLFNLFPPFPLVDKAFVAMSFDPMFENRWKEVIEPAITEDLKLGAFRADNRKISDSILTTITSSICDHRLIFADISVMFTHGRGKRRVPVRNPNVMYEVGLAHAVRQAEEVVLFRSDADVLPFDVRHIRVNDYDPDAKPAEARAMVREALQEALREVDLSKELSVKSAMRRLDASSLALLMEATWEGGSELLHTMKLGNR